MNKNRIRLTESQLHKVIKESVKKVLKENGYFDDEPHYLAQIFILDGDNIDDESFDNLRDACRWASEQVNGQDAPYKGYAAEVFYVDEYGDFNETGYYWNM